MKQSVFIVYNFCEAEIFRVYSCEFVANLYSIARIEEASPPSEGGL